MTVSFIILAVITVAGTAAAMGLRNAGHCVLALTVGFAGVAALYLQLGAQFVGFMQIMVYVGAVAILAVFAIMMTHSPTPVQPDIDVQQIGEALMHRFVLPLEIMGLLLTAALIGAVVIAMDRKEEPK